MPAAAPGQPVGRGGTLSAGDAPPAGAAWGGIVLIGATLLALLAANVPATADAYQTVLHAAAGRLSVEQWINDALMALFFLSVGLEIKHALVAGDLSRPDQRRLPLVAASAGMAVPALLYLAITTRTPGLAQGWAIPAATDIAFAIGIVALLGSRVPAALKLLLTAIAIVDDIGAVAIIALVYGGAIDGWALAAAAGVLAALHALARRGERRVWPFLPGGVLLWYLVLISGVHPTIAGVLLALVIPGGDDASPARRIEHALQPWIAFAILPLFVLANAGVSLAGLGIDTLLRPLAIGIAGGLFLGKQVAIFAAIRIAAATGLAARPDARWVQVYGIALLAGIGFTMSLFIGGLAFPGDAALLADVKRGVLAGSLLSGVCGYLVLRLAGDE